MDQAMNAILSLILGLLGLILTGVTVVEESLRAAMTGAGIGDQHDAL